MNAGGSFFVLIISGLLILRISQGLYLNALINLVAILTVFLAVWCSRRGHFNLGVWLLAMPTVMLAFITQFGVMPPARRLPQLAMVMLSLILIFDRQLFRVVYVLFCLLLLVISSLLLDGNWLQTFIILVECSAFAAIFMLYVHFFEGQDRVLNESIQDLERSNHDKKRANEELNERVEELIVFSHIMSHDLKGPLTAIRGYAELVKLDLDDGITTKDTNEGVEAILASVDSMAILISDLLTYSKISLADGVSEKVDLRRLVETVEGLLQFQIQSSSVKIQKGHLHAIMGNPDMFKTVIYNLMSNAIKYQPKDIPHHRPRIDIWSEESDETISLYLKDNGVGIDPEYLSDLFTPFKRDREGSYEGTGLGMSITEGIVEKFNGTIKVAETSAAGTTFELVFPHPRMAQPVLPPSPMAPTAPLTHPSKIVS